MAKDKERVLRWETTSRYYAARLCQDLLGDWVLERSWGGLYNNLGGAETTVVVTEQAGDSAISALHTRRTAHHYKLVSDSL